MTYHFRQEGVLDVDPANKLTSLVNINKNKEVRLYMASPTQNLVIAYTFEYKEDGDKKFKQTQKLGGPGGANGCHAGPIRGVTISQNDYMMVTNSFDSVSVWQLDFNAHKNTMGVILKQSITEENVLATLILPGNKFVLLGTRHGELCLFDVNQATIV